MKTKRNLNKTNEGVFLCGDDYGRTENKQLIEQGRQKYKRRKAVSSLEDISKTKGKVVPMLNYLSNTP
jgi:hypothetical protein